MPWHTHRSLTLYVGITLFLTLTLTPVVHGQEALPKNLHPPSLTGERFLAWISPSTNVPVQIAEKDQWSLIQLDVTTDPVLQSYVTAPIVKCRVMGDAQVSPHRTRIFIRSHTLLCATTSGSRAERFEGVFLALSDGGIGVPILKPAQQNAGHQDSYLLDESTKGTLVVELPALTVPRPTTAPQPAHRTQP